MGNIDIRNFRKTLGLSQIALGNILGIAQGYVSEIESGKKDLTAEMIERLENRFGADVIAQFSASASLRPHIPLLAAAGPLLGDAPSIGPADCEWLPVVPGFPSYDLTISVSGDSMAPGVMAGDRLYCRRLADKALIAWGQPYLVSTADGAAVKRLYDEGDALRCESDNPRYPPYLLPKRLVLAVYRVVALARF